MKVAVYARVSTRDRDQDPETQLMALRDYCHSKGWIIVEEFVDEAPARDLNQRVGWHKLLDQAAKRQFKAVVVWKLDRAFRSVKDMHDTLHAWELIGISFQSVTQNLDTTSATGRLLMNILGDFAQFESEMISERVLAGMARARAQGKPLGRPPLETYVYCLTCYKPGPPSHFRRNGHARRGHQASYQTVMARFEEYAPEVRAGTLTIQRLADLLGVDRRSVDKLLAAAHGE